MTVAELIARLQQEDPAATVVLDDFDSETRIYECRSIHRVTLRAYERKGMSWLSHFDEEHAVDERTVRFDKPVPGVLLQ